MMKGQFVFALFLLISLPSLAQEPSSSLPSIEEANQYKGSWNSELCGTEEEFAEKLNYLNDLTLCRMAASLGECKNLMGIAGAGSIAALRGARTSAAMSTDRPKLCPIGASRLHPDFLRFRHFALLEFMFTLQFQVAEARRDNACIARSEMATYKTRNYLQKNIASLEAVRNREREAIARVFQTTTPEVASDVFRNPPSSREGMKAYADELTKAVKDPASGVKPEYVESVTDYIDYMMEQYDRVDGNRPSAAQTWSDMRMGVQGRMGDGVWEIESEMGKRYAERINSNNSASQALKSLEDILSTQAPAAAPDALSNQSLARIESVVKEYPDLRPLIDEALEARAVASIAENQLTLYEKALKEVANPLNKTKFVNNPAALSELLGGLSHFDFEATQMDRMVVGNAVNSARDSFLGNRRSAASSIDWRGPLHGRLSEARKALVISGSSLAKNGVAPALKALSVTAGVMTGGLATTAQAMVTPQDNIACSHMQSQFKPTDKNGCGDAVTIDNPKVVNLLTSEPENQMREAMDHAGDICPLIDELAKKYGPESFRGQCNGDSGFTIVSRSQKGEQDLRIKAQFASDSGDVEQINVFGQKTFGHGGTKGLVFANGQFKEAYVPVEGGAWLSSMRSDPQATIDFQREGTFEKLDSQSVANVKMNGSIAAQEVRDSLDYLSVHRAMMTEVGACCTGVGAPSVERCNAYGITPAPESKPSKPSSVQDVGV